MCRADRKAERAAGDDCADATSGGPQKTMAKNLMAGADYLEEPQCRPGKTLDMLAHFQEV
jgi:hypothetical protein